MEVYSTMHKFFRIVIRIFIMILFCSNRIFAINLIGYVVDANTREPMNGVSIFEKTYFIGTTTNNDGFFCVTSDSINSPIKLHFSCVGYKDSCIICEKEGNLGIIALSPTTIFLEDITITGQQSKMRETPITTSTISALEIEERIGNSEFVEVLKSTPGIHAIKQGGGWGDSEIFMRGFDNSNVAVMVNGVPVNDMENGVVYWSNWAELGDVTAKIQVQRGIGTNMISAPSLGGSINIVTTGIGTKQGGSVSYMCGNDGYNKLSLSYHSGYTFKKWAISLRCSRTSGNGYAIGTNFEAYSYFLNLSKRINDNHQLTLVAFGSPQQHYMRSNALTKSEWEKVKDYNLYDKDWSCYNPDYGFDSQGQRRSSDFNKYHKPHISLNHIWQINALSNLSTTFYASIGYGYALSGDANSDTYTEYDWYGASEGKLNIKFRNTDGTFDYAKIEQINQASTTGSEMIMSKLKTNFQWYGLVSNYTNRFLECLNLTAGVDLRYFKGIHTNVISDLYCGSYYIDPVRKNVDVNNNTIATEAWQNQKLHVGDVVHRDYDCNIVQSGIFGQLEYSKNNLSAFISGALSYDAMWRYDRLFYDETNAESDIAHLFGGSIKMGVNYNITQKHNVYANVGFISKVPPFKNGVFMSANTSNVLNTDAKNEKAVSAEIGYGFHCKYLNINLAGYYTEWMDKTMAKRGTMDNGEQYVMNMTGVNARHMGVELDLKSAPAKWIELNAMVSIGDWRWTSDSIKGWAFDVYGQALSSTGEVTSLYSPTHAWAMINMKDVHVGGSAQTTAAFSVFFRPYQGIRIGAEYNLYDRNFAYFSLSGNKLKIGKIMKVSEAWRVPLGGQLDLRASYMFSIHKVNFLVAAQVNNIIGQRYIEKAWNPSNISVESKEVNPNDVYFFYAQGRSWNIKFKVFL